MAVSLRSPLDPTQPIRAVLFDLDGTLYHQARLRGLMALELLTLPLSAPFRARRRWRALAAFRRAQEHLRPAGANGSHQGSITSSQIESAATRSGLPAGDVSALVDEWMMRRPLKYLRWCRATGVDTLLDHIASAGARLGVLSDYPAEAKLGALGLAGRFSPILCSTDPAIDMLKPGPRGFLRACELWRLPPREVLYVGDRVEVDAAGAAAAGMPCVIVGSRGNGAPAPGHLAVPSLEALRRVLTTRG